MVSTIVTILYLIMVGILCLFLVRYLFNKNSIWDKISIAVVLVMFLLRLFLIK